jgi:hypothetical protein
VKIYFKDVDQGDSIIIEWKEGELTKLVIIDCNTKEDGANPVLEHIKALQNYSIEIVILSHPHTDHFSGLNELLDYAQTNQQPIKYFLHTCHSVPANLLSAVRGRLAKDELTRLFARAKELDKKGIIGGRIYVDSGMPVDFKLEGNWRLKFLSPSSQEIDDYNSKKYSNLDTGKINRGDANLLATSIKIFNEIEYVLLTSDLPSHVFDAIWTRNLSGCTKKMKICQVSHHGSQLSFNAGFWSRISRSDNVPAIISFGKNDYGHPSPEVIAGMQALGYDVRLTNPLLAANPFVKVIKKMSMLSMISKPARTVRKGPPGMDIDFTL